MHGDLHLNGLAGASAESLVRREWLVTNGLGGYSSGTLLGPHTRKYHGLFVPNLVEPNGRHVLLSMMSERLEIGERVVELAGARTVDGVLASDAAGLLESFSLEAGMPVWRYSVDGLRLTRQITMPHAQNVLCIHYRIERDAPVAPTGARTQVRLRLRPWTVLRRHDQDPDDDARRRGDHVARIIDGRPVLEVALRGASLVMRVAVKHERASCCVAPESLRQTYSLEADRGYPPHETHFSAGVFDVPVEGRVTELSLIACLAPADPLQLDAAELFAAERRRVRALHEQARSPQDQLAARLVLAADQFIIRPGNRPEEQFRAEAAGSRVRTVIAGYHWFGDWGRDTMISLEGLTLCTGRAREAAAILRTFAGYVRDGLLPNLFPEGAREALYHTVDATLWFFHAIERYQSWTGDVRLVDDVMPVLESICEHYVRGTRYGIGVDPRDGLVRAGAEGYQLTWMDAKAGDWVVTPRRGKPVEIQALWYNALRLMVEWRTERGIHAGDYDRRAREVRDAFNARFWNESAGCLYDIVDSERGDDDSGRPNQVFAMSLRHPVLEQRHWPAVLAYVRTRLLTPYGLRTLDPAHPDYKPNYHGDLLTRDGAYHQGTVWPWLIGHYVDAMLRASTEGVARDADGALGDALSAFTDHLSEFGIGSIAEIFDAESPFLPRGCIAQAWSVAEVLRARMRLLGLRAGAADQSPPLLRSAVR